MMGWIKIGVFSGLILASFYTTLMAENLAIKLSVKKNKTMQELWQSAGKNYTKQKRILEGLHHGGLVCMSSSAREEALLKYHKAEAVFTHTFDMLAEASAPLKQRIERVGLIAAAVFVTLLIF